MYEGLQFQQPLEGQNFQLLLGLSHNFQFLSTQDSLMNQFRFYFKDFISEFSILFCSIFSILSDFKFSTGSASDSRFKSSLNN